MTAACRAAEVVAIVALVVAARALIDAIHRDVLCSTHSLDWYVLWVVALVPATLAIGRPPLAVPREVWTRATLVVLALVLVATEYLYGFKLLRVVTGQIALHAPASAELAINAAIAAPLVEEWLFRGVAWDAIERRAGALAALSITSLLFGVWHCTSMLHPTWMSPVGVPIYAHAAFGALMGILRWRLRSLAGGLAVHVLYNALYVVSG